MHSRQAHIGVYKGMSEEHILNKIQLYDVNRLRRNVKANKHFSSTVQELYVGMPIVADSKSRCLLVISIN